MYWMCVTYSCINISNYAWRESNLVWKRFKGKQMGRGEANVWIQAAGLGPVSNPCFRQLEFIKRKQELQYPLSFISARSEVLMANKTVCWNAVSLKSELQWENTNKCLMMWEVKHYPCLYQNYSAGPKSALRWGLHGCTLAEDVWGFKKSCCN